MLIWLNCFKVMDNISENICQSNFDERKSKKKYTFIVFIFPLLSYHIIFRHFGMNKKTNIRLRKKEV